MRRCWQLRGALILYWNDENTEDEATIDKAMFDDLGAVVDVLGPIANMSYLFESVNVPCAHVGLRTVL